MSDAEPYLVTYLLSLRETFPVAHGTTMGQDLGTPEPLLQGVQRQVFPDGPVVSASGNNFVSFKFWQVETTGETPTVMEKGYRAASTVLGELVGEGDGEQSGAAGAEEFTTVVEAVTFVADGVTENDDGHPALTRCVEHLLDLHRAYRVGLNRDVPALTYSGINPIVLWTKRDLEVDPTRKRHQPSGVVLLSHVNFGVPEFEEIPPSETDYLLRFYVRDRVGDPFIVFRDHLQRANFELSVNHEPGRAVMDSAIAAEVLFSTVLGLMLWEESLAGKITDDQARGILKLDLEKRLKHHFHIRLGGNWGPKGTKISDWRERVAGPRHRVVHAGYRATYEEAGKSLDTLSNLSVFIGDRLSAKYKTYPRTAWLYLGEAGFEKRDRLKAIERTLGEEVEDQLDWLRKYQKWRENLI